MSTHSLSAAPVTARREVSQFRLAINAVREHNGNKTLAARSLSISRAYLHRLIRLAEPDQLEGIDLRETVTA